MKYVNQYTKEISFPIGGIGTGSIGIGGDGTLIDWEIFNRPAKGSINGYSHFAIRAIKCDKIIPMVMQGDVNKEFTGRFKGAESYTGYGWGPDNSSLRGFPHFKKVVFDGEFPIATLTFNDDKFPADVKLKAFNPFIPRDSHNSGIPAAFFEVEINNTDNEEIIYEVAFTVSNPYKVSHNESAVIDGIKTLTLSNGECGKDSVDYGELTVATDCEKSCVQTYWYRGNWSQNILSFWNDFSSEKTIPDRTYNNDGENETDTGTLIAQVKVLSGEIGKLKFVLSWNVPNCYNYWSEYKDESGKDVKWKNYYATVFENSISSATYSLKNWDNLYERTNKFKNALYSSTLPEVVIEAAAFNLSVLKSPTVFRLEDGSFYGWEGVSERYGLCEGTCQHVWNYAYALCFLFPDLERSIRDLEFKYSTDKTGRMGFRLQLPLGREMSDWRACVDGQMGSVIKCYREWKISGDNEWLKSNWNNIKKVLEYAWSDKNPDCWDRDKDGVLEGRQHHTLDKELFGASSWLEGMYLVALKAAAEMGEFLGDTQSAKIYNNLFEKGYNWTKENLFNGKYFIQKIDIKDKSLLEKYDALQEYWNDELKQIVCQIGEGCAIDQMLAQWHSYIIGLGNIFDKNQISVALSNMMENNFKSAMREFTNPWRLFALDDESGTVICEYPDGAQKPRIPIPYYGETMTGFEYAFAGLLFAHGKTQDGMKVVKAVRDRFDGEKRNPWNEFECGNNYARSMSSYALIPILSGFEFDMPNNHIGFNPYVTNNFKCIWSLADAWGNFVIVNKTIKVDVYEGKITLKSLGLKFCNEISNLKIDGKDTDFEFENGIIYFKETYISDCIEIIL